MWSILRFDFGFDDEEKMWDLYPCEVYALMDRKKEEIEREQTYLGTLVWSIFKANNPKFRKKLQDFIPGKPKKQTWQEQLKMVENLNALFGGRDLRRGRRGIKQREPG